ncbi:hypothetical protein [Streptomyces sp. JHA26]|uniref:hypothetical protein n=1 Tax=Streptomyces sp. JHA26 TaxID=1917143 RepID=UPI00098B3DF8|nr:hypothetical protein [Streptomyces sp. JHA26]
MRRLACAVAAAAAVLLGGGPGAAAAEGAPLDQPDVAVVVWSGTGRTASWHAGEPDFDRLRDLLEQDHPDTERVPGSWTAGGAPPVRLTVLWGMTGVGGWPQTRRAPGGDVAMLRQDQLLVAEDGTPWVRTDPAPDVADDDIRWRRAPRRVYDRLAAEGFLGEEPADAGDGGGGGPWGGVRWGAAGLAAGVAATLLVRRAAARHGAGPPRGEPRQELIDL